MTGGGFGGCTINLVHESAVEEFRRHITNRYVAATGLKPDIFVSRPADAAGAVDA
jgi:galactokinase